MFVNKPENTSADIFVFLGVICVSSRLSQMEQMVA